MYGNKLFLVLPIIDGRLISALCSESSAGIVVAVSLATRDCGAEKGNLDRTTEKADDNIFHLNEYIWKCIFSIFVVEKYFLLI